MPTRKVISDSFDLEHLIGLREEKQLLLFFFLLNNVHIQKVISCIKGHQKDSKLKLI